MFKKVNVYKLKNPIEEFKYNVQILFSSDGTNWYYCGFGRFCKTIEEVESYKKMWNIK